MTTKNKIFAYICVLLCSTQLYTSCTKHDDVIKEIIEEKPEITKPEENPEVTKPEEKPETITLKADTTALISNGKDSITFSVITSKGNNVTDDAIIYEKDENNQESIMKGHIFCTTKNGILEFYAKYKDQTSDTITINAIAPTLTITADKTNTRTGEAVTFSATAENDKDVSQSIKMHIFNDDMEETTLEGNIFEPSSFGRYSIYATCEERISDTVQIQVAPVSITLTADKNTIISSGKDTTTFTVSADGKTIDSAEIYLLGTKLKSHFFATEEQGEYTFYAMYDGLKSDDVSINVSRAKFFKQSCAMEVVSSWCGFSPQMMEAFEGVYQSYSDHIQIVSMHSQSSLLSSSDINAENFLAHFNISSIPYGRLDLKHVLLRSVSSVENSYILAKNANPATSGIAVYSQKKDNRIDVTLKIKVDETNEYSVCAIIVEDSVISKQRYFLNGSMEDYIWKDKFINNGVATYIMPGTKPYSGKSLGMMQAGGEKTESFSISLNKSVTDSRKINYDKCRVVAYVMKKGGSSMYINNATSCPINASIDYKYE